MSVFVQHADREPVHASRPKHWLRGLFWTVAFPVLFVLGLILMAVSAIDDWPTRK